MLADNLLNKKKLLAIIEKIGKAPWAQNGHEELIPYDAVMLAIKSPKQGVSPAELAEILKEAAMNGAVFLFEDNLRLVAGNLCVIRDCMLKPFEVTRKVNEILAVLNEAVESQAPNQNDSGQAPAKLTATGVLIQEAEEASIKQAPEDSRKAEAWDDLYNHLVNSINGVAIEPLTSLIDVRKEMDKF